MADPTFVQILAILDDHFQGGSNLQPGVNAVDLAGALRRLASLGGAGGTQTDLIFDPATELTIAAGVIAATQAAHTVDTQADAASDILDSITGGTAEELLFIRPANAARTVVIAHAIGADLITCPGGQNISLAEATDFAILYYDGTQWIVVGYSTLALGGGGLGLALASVANGFGASLIGLEDAGTFFAATDVEAALAELTKYVPLPLADPGSGVAIPVARSANIAITTAAAETNTLAIPAFIGQILQLGMDVRVVGDRVITASAPINDAGNTTMTFGAAGDAIELKSFQVAGALVWRIMGNEGVTLA